MSTCAVTLLPPRSTCEGEQMAAKRQLPEGISLRHTRACSVHVGGDCDCWPTYQAQVFSARHRRRLSRSFPTPSAARNWRRDALVDLRRGTLTPGRAITLRQAAAEWESAAEAGVVRNRAGDAYKPSTLRGYRHALEQRLLPALGAVKLADIRRADVQRLVARMLEQGSTPARSATR